MKWTVFALVGGLIGVVLASLFIPPALSWYAAPGGLPQGTQIQALVDIPTVIRYATGKLIFGQLIGCMIGVVIGIVTAFAVRRKTPSATVRNADTIPRRTA